MAPTKKSANRWWHLAALLCAWLSGTPAMSQAVFPPPSPRWAMIEVFLHRQDPKEAATLVAVEEFVSARPGINLHVHDLDGDKAEAARDRLTRLCRAFKVDSPQTPVYYSCNTVIHGVTDPVELTRRLRQVFRIDVYVRTGCARCEHASQFLTGIRPTYPGFEIRYFDILVDVASRDELDRIIAHYQQPAASVPVFHLCNQLIVGFEDASTGRRIDDLLRYWTFAGNRPMTSRSGTVEHEQDSGVRLAAATIPVVRSRLVQGGDPLLPIPGEDSGPPFRNSATLQPLPGETSEEGMESGFPPIPGEGPLPGPQSGTIVLPWFGSVSLTDWGMPAFTIIVGLVDGFNPCAMWVLLFLLSILVNVKDRWRIVAIAGTFVFISGLAYFAFMAAWLNVFMLIGLLRPIQVGLAVLAILIGCVHIKDFFAFKQGLTLSIPDSVKPRIYERVRRVVNAENLWGAMIGVTVLAVFVNIVELLCTAGLPALYTQILTLQGYPQWKNYAYLGLYNLAYMFDDALMVSIVVVTLGKRKMQESHGRWLKLLSGCTIALLGLVMLFRPDWLH